MPSDIRSFFGGGPPKPSTPATSQNTSQAANSSKKQRRRKILVDSDDEELEEKPKASTKAASKSKPKVEEPQLEETTSSAYFASKTSKSNKSTPIRTKAQNGAPPPEQETPTKKTQMNGSGPLTARKSTRKTAAKNYIDSDNDATVSKVDDNDEGGDDIFAEDFKRAGRKAGDDYEDGSGDDVMVDVKHSKRTNGISKSQAKTASKKVESEDKEMLDVVSYDGAGDSKRKRAAAKPKASSKRNSKDEETEDAFLDDEDDLPKKKARKTAASSTPRSKAPAKKEAKEDSKEIQDILNSVPTVRAPTPPARDGEAKKFGFGGQNNAKAAPIGSSNKEIPLGADNCLAGRTFVFTGVLESLGREEGQSLVKRYGGKVTTGPSKNTSFVVLGTDAGPKKLDTIAKLGLITIDEDGLFELIRKMPANGGDSVAAEKAAEKREKEEKAMREAAAEMEREERKREKDKAALASKNTSSAAPATNLSAPSADTRLWVDKYAPSSMGMVCGNAGQVTKLQNWLRRWPESHKYNFKKAGADGLGIYRAVMLHGPPGIGKTTAAHLVANLEGYDVVESNASDTRSKRLVETGLRGVLDTTSLLGYFAGDGQKVDATKRKLVLIMDEVDGMSAGDRGGVGALAQIAKKTSVPMILICNERRLPKMKPFDFVTGDLPFRRPTIDMIRGRMKTICFREKLNIPTNVLDALIEGCGGDIRQIINMVSTAKLDQESMDYDDGKKMSKAWEKHIVLKPWDIVGKILRPQTFAPSSSSTLNDKIELYFNDHEFSYMMLQENYLQTNPTRAAGNSGKMAKLKLLELADSAAQSISDGDLVDRMIHGSQQQWSLMPFHAVTSFVRPASYMNGNFTGRPGFVTWLGQNSKYGKLGRFIKEIQGHMRLKGSGDRHEVRQQYLPMLWVKTVKRLKDEGKEIIPEIIELMDSYYLTLDDYQAIKELGVGPMSEEGLEIDGTVKGAFTRLYNQQSHPVPFMKASSIVAPKAAQKAKPDLEDAIDESDIEEVPAEGEEKQEEDEETDIKKDKYIQAPKKRKAAPKKAPATKKTKRISAKDSDDEEDNASEDDVKPKKATSGRGRSGSRGGGRGRGRGK